MSSIDERVVNMKFNNAQFQSGIQSTLGALDKLKSSLNLSGAAKGLDGLGAAAKNVNLGHIAAGVDTLASKFSNLGIIGITALTNIANKAVNAGLSLVKSLTIGPISEGFNDYNAKLTSVQTIMNATGASIEKVDGYFKQLDTYADKTIYNLSDMTGAFAKFTNAGLDMSVSVPAIKGIANMVALAGQGADAASIAMYNLSQSIAGGFLTTTDYKSLNLANVATKEWKDQMIAGAVAAGTLTKSSKGMYTIKGGKKAYTDASLFADALSEGWASADVLTTVLGDYGDATTKIGKKALAAAQNVKSLPMMMDTLKASVGTGWTDTFELLFGNVTEATKLWTGLTNTISGFIGAATDARNIPLGEWKKLGGREAVIDGLKNAFQALMSVLKPIGDAFRAVFPPTTGKQLVAMSEAFRDFFKGLILGKENMDRLKRTFQGIFSIFSIVWAVVKGVASGFMSLFGIVGGGTGGFLAMTAVVGDFLSKINEWIVKSGAIKAFFDAINAGREAVLVPLIAVISKVVEAFAALLHGDISGFKAKMGDAFSGVVTLVEAVRKKFDEMLGTISRVSGTVGTYLTELKTKVGASLSGLATTILTPLIAMFESIGTSVQTLKAKFVNLIPKLDTSGLTGVTGDMSALNVIAERSKSVWDGLVNAFNNVKASLAPVTSRIGEVLAAIADKIIAYIKDMGFEEAVALLNTAFFIAMYKALKDFMGNMKEIGTAIAGTFDALTESLSVMQQAVKAQVVMNIAIAIGILVAALFLLSTIEPAKLAAALGAIGVLMFMITKALGGMLSMMEVVEGKTAVSSGKLLAAGGAIMLLAAGILLLSSAVKKLGDLDWQELLRGLGGVGALLGGLGLFAKFVDMEKMSMKGAASLAILAGAVYLLSFSVSKLGQMDQNALIQGAIAVEAILISLAAVSEIMGDNKSMKGAAGIAIMAGALAILAPVLAGLGLLPYEVLAKGLGTIAIALGLLAVASKLMADPKTMAGAASIAALGLAIAIMAPALALLGVLPYENLAKGLGTIGISLALLAGASKLMGDPKSLAGAVGILALAFAMQMLTPALIALSMVPMDKLAVGLGALAIALAIFLIAGAVASLGPVAAGLVILSVAILAIGVGMGLAGAGFLAFATGFAALVAVGTAGFAILITGFAGLLNLIPLFAQQLGLGLIAFAKVISDAGPVMVAALTTILLSLLRAIDNVMPKFFDTMGRLIMGLVNKVAELAPKIYDAGLRMILGFLRAIDSKVYQIVTIALSIIKKFLKGITDGLPGIIKQGTALIVAFIKGIGDAQLKIVTAAMETIVKFVSGVAAAIRTNSDKLNAAGGDLAKAIISGFLKGLVAIPASIARAGWDMGKRALEAAQAALKSHSPSREFEKLGIYANQGFAIGLVGGLSLVKASLLKMSTLITTSIKTTANDVAAAQKKLAGLKKSHASKAAITAAAKSLKQSQLLHLKAEHANVAFTKWLASQKKGLLKLATQYDVVTGKLAKARTALADAKKVQADFKATTTDQFDNLPEIEARTSPLSYKNALKKETEDNNKFRDALEKLRLMGMDDTTYRKLLAEGTAVQPFLEKLIAGGSDGVKELNELNKGLASSAASIGSQASTDLYQAGVNAAQGLVNGLASQQKAIEAQMNKIAKYMVASIKRQLGIKSPSKVFAEIGKYSNEGLAKGLDEYSGIVKKSAAGVGGSAIDAMRKSISGMSDLITGDIDMTPVIRPVLDLTDMRKGSLKIDSILNTKPISVDSAYSTAKDASAGYRRNIETFAQNNGSPVPQDKLTFIQNNNSPKALSAAEIYRQTKNQLSVAKGALTT